MFELTSTWPNFTFPQSYLYIGGNNYQKRLPKGYTSEFEQYPNIFLLYLIYCWSIYCKLWYLTRLLGRPKSVYMGQQNIIYIYVSRPHKHFKIDFTPKLSSQQHVKYGSNLMNIFDNFSSIYGGPGEAYVESRGTIVS